MQHLIITGLLLAHVVLAGCYGTIEPLRLPAMPMKSAVHKSRLVVAVAPFRDQRQETEHIGTHTCRKGETEYIDLQNGDLGHTLTRSMVHFLKRSGFFASVATDEGVPDVRIEADIKSFTADVTDGRFSSLLEVNATIGFTVYNAADQRTTQTTIGIGETIEEMFFDHHEMEDLINSALKEGFTKLLETANIPG